MSSLLLPDGTVVTDYDNGEDLVESALSPDLHVATSEYEQLRDLSPSEFAQSTMNILPGFPFSLDEREYLYDPYDGDQTEVMFMCGRQTEKSTSLGNMAIADAVMCPGIRVLYVSPSDRQTKTFSFERVRTVVLNSPLLHRYVPPGTISVYDQRFTNGSIIKLRSCFLTPDRVRGERGDRIFFDEYQDILPQNIPVIKECAFHANPLWMRFTYSGTPKTYDNPIEVLFGTRSTMTELMFPCRSHGEYNKPWTWHWFPITEECFGLTGLICPKCGKPINHMDPKAQWVDTAPKARKRRVKGYHIPQPMTPMAHETPEKWNQILIKREDYPRGKFMNEVMGQSYDYGDRPITSAIMAGNQEPAWEMRSDQLRKMMKLSARIQVYAGIDWGGEEKSESSATSITLGTYHAPKESQRDARKFFQFYWHRFEGAQSDPEYELERIIDLLTGFNVDFTVADFGMGNYQNNKLGKVLGPKRFCRLQYVGKQNMGPLVWREKLGWMTGYKTVLCDLYVNLLRQRRLVLPKWDVMNEVCGSDFLNLKAEYVEARDERRYVSGGAPVDAFHSGLYCLVASLRDHPRKDVTHIVVDSSETSTHHLPGGVDVGFIL